MSDEPNASWHPAFMPQAVAKPAASAPPASNASIIPAEQLPTGVSEPPSPPASESYDDSGVDAWFPEYEASSSLTENPSSDPLGAAVDTSASAAPPEAEEVLPAPGPGSVDELEVPEETIPTEEPVHPDLPEPALEPGPTPAEPTPAEPEPAVPEPTTPELDKTTPIASPVDANASKHYSTVSFTRTVANDVNWDADDDDQEWNLSRSDTDPFQFMSPSDRTNSFPVVPTLAEKTTSPSRPQPQVDTVPVAVSNTDAAMDAWGLGDSDDPEDDSFFAGTAADDDANAAPDASWDEPTARFQEGVPLLPRSADETAETVQVTKVASESTKPKTSDPFAEADADEDDFFKAGAPSDVEAAASEPEPEPRPFERKSTMQVLQSMNIGQLDRQDSDMGAVPEEEAPIPEEPAAAAEPATTGEEPKKSSTDLAAQWAAVFDDEEDGLMLEDCPPEPETAVTTEPAETKALDPAAFFGDDDEGFLEDEPEEPQPQQQPAAATSNRYLPMAAQAPAQPTPPTNPYLPTPAFTTTPQPSVPSPYTAPSPAPSQFPINYGYNGAVPPASQQPPRPTLHKAQSFADKSKGGYSSPYDLPMDVVKPPRKRQSMQHLSKPADAVSAPPQGLPPRSMSMQHLSKPADAVSAPPQGLPPRSMSMQHPPMDVHAPTPPPSVPAAAAATPPQAVKHESFFEDLPMLPKARPASRHSQASSSYPTPYAAPPTAPPQSVPPPMSYAAQAPPQASPYTPAPAQPQMPTVPPPAAHYAPLSAAAPAVTAPPMSEAPATPPSDATTAGLVAPPRINPYATLQSGPAGTVPPAAGATRYSPSPSQLPPPNGAAAQPSRYSPAPPNRVPSAPMPTPPILPHQPRTSSPLAHFEMSYDKPRATSVGHAVVHNEVLTAERRSSSSMFEARLGRAPSLPPTREEEEEAAAPPPPQQQQQRPYSSGNGAQPYAAAQTSQYSPQRTRQTPPPPATRAASQATLSPPKRILGYAPQTDGQLSPPRRSQTQSPGAAYGNSHAIQPADLVPRPSSVHEPTAPAPSRPRAASQHLNLVPPTDGSETDPLQRWKGAPIFVWGAGGTFVSSFPQDVPRYGMNQTLPMIHRSPGEVHVKNMKEVQPLEDRISKFPGPLKGKSKKKEVLSWLTAGIENLEQSLPRRAFNELPVHDDKRLEERVLLWKILRLFIEHDGVLEGSPAVEKAVREVLAPFAATAPDNDNADNTAEPSFSGFMGGVTTTQTAQSDAVDMTVVEQIRKNLLVGDKEKAAWDAVDKRLWGHAFLIAGAASRELFKKVAQEFVRKEVNTPGLHNESLAALYEVLSGNHDECVDELVPVHARAGLQLMTTLPTAAGGAGGTDDGLAGLDKWRETLCLVLSNRSTDDVQAINSLGNLLAGYGRAEAAHVCFLFARSVAVFGGLDDPTTNVVLLGADHRGQADAFSKETDAILLSEVYEYGMSLTGTSNLGAANSPHLAAYKLQHAMLLAEHGMRDRALQYCEAIVAAMGAQTRRSPYYHPLLETAVEDLMKRLKHTPKEESNSWIPKPSMNKVSDSVWNRFNKFVAGDDGENVGPGGPDGPAGSENGPFAHIASGAPTISRPPSSGGFGAGGATGMEMFGGVVGGASGAMYGAMPNGSAAAVPPMPVPITRAASRYAPGASMAASVAASPPAHGAYSPTAEHSPLGVSPASSAPAPIAAHNPYEPTAVPYGAAPSSRRVSADQSIGEPSPYLPRTSSELASGYNASAPAPHAGSAEPTSQPQGLQQLPASRPALSRASSYAPVSYAEPTLPVASYAPAESVAPAAAPTAYNPYAPATSAESAAPAAAPAAYNPYAPPNGAAATGSASQADKADVTSAEKADDANHGNDTAAAVPDYGYQPVSYGYEPPSMNTSFEPASNEAAADNTASEQGNGHAAGYDATGYGGGGGGGYEPPSFQPYSYEPPSYEPDRGAENGGAGAGDSNENGAPKLKPRSFMDDYDDDMPSMKPASDKADEKSREEKDRENAEMFRKIAEEENRAAAEKEAKAAKKGWGLTSWWGGGKKDAVNAAGGEAPKAVRANLGEKNSFYFDPELKRWVNKNASPDDQATRATPPPPPPRSSGVPSSTSTPPPPAATTAAGAGAPPMGAPPAVRPPSAVAGGPPGMPPAMARSASTASAASGPPSRPPTGMSDANSIDDLLGAVPGPRRASAKKGRKSGRYVDVMAK